jgi:hypothetical protein
MILANEKVLQLSEQPKERQSDEMYVLRRRTAQLTIETSRTILREILSSLVNARLDS